MINLASASVSRAVKEEGKATRLIAWELEPCASNSAISAAFLSQFGLCLDQSAT